MKQAVADSIAATLVMSLTALALFIVGICSRHTLEAICYWSSVNSGIVWMMNHTGQTRPTDGGK
jgi:hypothetical protein